MRFARTTRLPRRVAHALKYRIEDSTGGPARARVVVLFACVLALDSADLATVGAVAPQLETAFRISYAQLGLLSAISTFVGAVATVPFGALVDRVRRVPLLTVSIAIWAVAMLVGAGAQSYSWLLLSRLGLGAVTAVAFPAIASLTGDLFRVTERGKIYGFILSGELIGVGIGYVISGSLASVASWRWGFAFLALPAIALSVVFVRLLPEPSRGGPSRLAVGARDLRAAHEHAAGDTRASGKAGTADGEDVGLAREAIERERVDPVERHILREDPSQMSIWQAIPYVLSIKTNRWLIIAAASGYFFFAGMRTFALVFVRGQFSLGQGVATAVLFCAGLGAVAGALISGQVADRLIRRGQVNGRVIVGAICYLAAAVVLIPGLIDRTLAIAFPFLVLGAAGFSAPNPPLDAARLDIMPAGLWGRAEGVRTLLRQTAQAAAPLLFGVVADALGGRAVNASNRVTAANTRGLAHAFLLMLVPLAASGAILLWKARPHYASDVATALASAEAIGAAQAGTTPQVRHSAGRGERRRPAPGNPGASVPDFPDRD